MQIAEKVKERLSQLPDKPGVYVMRDRTGRIIYVGKAASLRNRVRHYFQTATLRSADPKLRGLIRSVSDLEVLLTNNEADALLTERRMIAEYRPRYNVALRDDKRFLLLRIRPADAWPRFELCRIERRDGADYFGPYANSSSVYTALEFVERRFGLRNCRPLVPDAEDHRHCHADIVRFCTAPCIGKIDSDAYHARVVEACAFLRGERREILDEIVKQMETAAESRNYEKAATLRDIVMLLRKAIRQRATGSRTLEMKDEEAKAGLDELYRELNLPAPPRVIECFDISNISGTHAVASMVCAVNGMPAKSRYRRFRIKTIEGSDDPAMMAEVIRRRYTRVRDEKKPLPDLVLIDGGVTQLGAAREELRKLGLDAVQTAGLAKRFEELVVSTKMTDAPVRLPSDSPGLKVVTRLRDEAHRFALTYHRALRQRRIRESLLDDIEGIGEKRKEVILKHFGSVLRLKRASEETIAAVPGVGPVLAKQIKARLS